MEKVDLNVKIRFVHLEKKSQVKVLVDGIEMASLFASTGEEIKDARDKFFFMKKIGADVEWRTVGSKTK
jgi:hypothetical protein